MLVNTGTCRLLAAKSKSVKASRYVTYFVLASYHVTVCYSGKFLYYEAIALPISKVTALL